MADAAGTGLLEQRAHAATKKVVPVGKTLQIYVFDAFLTRKANSYFLTQSTAQLGYSVDKALSLP